MVLTVALLVLGALLMCAGGTVKIFRALALDPLDMLMWIGLAEQPPLIGPRRR